LKEGAGGWLFFVRLTPPNPLLLKEGAFSVNSYSVVVITAFEIVTKPIID